MSEAVLSGNCAIEEEGAYIRISRKLNNLPSGNRLLGAFYSSFSGAKQKDDTLSVCTRTDNWVVENLGMSKSAIYRARFRLKALDYLKTASPKNYVFNQDKIDFETFDRAPFEFLNAEYDNGKGKKCRLTYFEKLGFAHFYTECNNDKLNGDEETETAMALLEDKKKKRRSWTYTTTDKELAVILGCSERTAGRVANRLMKAGVIHRPMYDKGNRGQRSTYTLDKKYRRKARRKRSDKKAEPEAKEKEVKPQAPSKSFGELKAEVERIFYDRRHVAEERAERAHAAAMADPLYKELHKEITGLEIKIAFAEIKDPESAKKLAARKTELEKQSDKRLSGLRIDKRQFAPQYQCKVCNDTGYRVADGKPCKCMHDVIARLRGSPGKANVGVGELNTKI